MSLDGNCGKSGQTNFFCIMLPVGIFLCMLGQYLVFPPLAAIIAAGCRGMLDPAGLGGAHQNSGVGCSYWWLHGPIHPIYVLWGCSLAILQAAPSWWRCPAERNQGQPKVVEVWHYGLGSGSYPRNVAWQMALSCLVKAMVKLIVEVSVGEYKRRFRINLKSSRDVFRTTTSLNSIAWHLRWKRSPGTRRTLSLPCTG